MRVEQQPAFILHARAYRETSLLIECLTRDHGRVGLVARGVRRERARFSRAALQPLVALQVGWSGRGELATLTQAEAVGAAFDLSGESLLCALYLNELVLRLTPRQDAQAGLFADYLQALTHLAGEGSRAWTLRRFERDLLAHLGYALVLEGEAENDKPIDSQSDYSYRHAHGPELWRDSRDGLRLRGSALLALSHDREPGREDLASLRWLLRNEITIHLDGGELRAWHMLGTSAG